MISIAQELSPVVGISQACAALGIPRSRLYPRRRPAPSPRPAPAHALSDTTTRRGRNPM